MKRQRVVSDMPLETYERLKTMARNQNRSISSMVARLVAISTGTADPEPFSNTQVHMPTSASEREAMLERIR